jgi:hypothetical protein
LKLSECGWGWLLSLKFHPQMVTGIQHLQTPISSSMAQKMHFQRAQNYTTGYKISMRSEYKGSTRTCASRKHQKSAHAPDARLWMQKATHTSERRIYDFGRPSTHFWFISQVDLTPKSELNPSGGLVKDLRVP